MSPSTNPITERPFTYNFIPTLKHLLPRTGGRPGVEYLQVSVMNLRDASTQGWSLIEDSQTYTIQGPTGSVDMQIYGRGEPISGASPFSGRRVCYLDQFAPNTTGLPVPNQLSLLELKYTGTQPVPTTTGPKPVGLAKE